MKCFLKETKFYTGSTTRPENICACEEHKSKCKACTWFMSEEDIVDKHLDMLFDDETLEEMYLTPAVKKYMEFE